MEWICAQDALPQIPEGKTGVKCMAIVSAEGAEFVVKMEFRVADGKPRWRAAGEPAPDAWRITHWRLA